MNNAIKLTDNQAAVLAAFPTCHDTADAQKDDNGSWADVEELAKETGKTVKAVKGVIGSLVKKGLVDADENTESGAIQCLTDAGIDALFAMKAEAAKPTNKDIANLLFSKKGNAFVNVNGMMIKVSKSQIWGLLMNDKAARDNVCALKVTVTDAGFEVGA